MQAWLACVLVLALAVIAAAADPRPRVPILLDTDIGDDIDDAFALALVLASPELDLRGVTTVAGDAFTRALIVCHWLEAAQRADIPVASGSPTREQPTQTGQFQYGQRLGFRKRPEQGEAVEFLYSQLKAQPGKLTLLAIGPLTNVAELLRRHPDCTSWIKWLVVMGGSIRQGYEGKATPEPEWNIKNDIKAARTVFAAGVPLVLAPLDATADLRLEPAARQRLFRTPGPRTQELFSLYQLWDGKTPILFDPLAVALCFTEEFCTMKDLALQVDDRGMTRIGAGKPTARVATASRRDPFLRWYVERLAPAAVAPQGKNRKQ